MASPSKALFGLALSAAVTACAAQSDDANPTSPDEQASAWDAESATNEAESTHLWIVNHAIGVLAKHTDDPVAARMSALLDDATCRASWQQGLLDADFKAAYNNGRHDMPTHPSDAQVALAGATWESHFYDPDTGRNYKGAVAPTARTEAKLHLDRAIEGNVADRDPDGCYELGLALHYYTDLTQPMHASNFTALDRPSKLHSNLEGYSLEIQDRYPLSDWSGAPSGTLDDFVLQTARDSKPLFKEGVDVIVSAYAEYRGWHIITCSNLDYLHWRLDERYCWEGNPRVDAIVGKSLLSAQDHTAKFLYLVAQRLDAERP